MAITSDTSSIYKIKSLLPSSVSNALSRLDKAVLDRISEIRLRKDGITTLTIDGKNQILTLSGITHEIRNGIKCSSAEIEDFIYRFCKCSVYSHENTLSDFYIVNDGIRAGLAGEAIYQNGNLTGIGNVQSVCIRLPHHIENCSETLMNHIKRNGFYDGSGILVISSPGVGKTTLLRDLAIKLSCDKEFGFKRVCVIDERREIYMDKIFSECCIDFLSGMDKIKGLEISCRVLSPQIIICDEISGPEECEKITRQKNTGVTFIASLHSQNPHDAMKKDYIRKMFEEKVFSHIYLLERHGTKVTGSIFDYKDLSDD